MIQKDSSQNVYDGNSNMSGSSPFVEKTDSKSVSPNSENPIELSSNNDERNLNMNDHKRIICDSVNKRSFLFCVVLVSICSFISYFYLSWTYRESQREIVQLQCDDARYIKRMINDGFLHKHNALQEEQMLNNVLDRHQTRIEGLLELEYNKLQSDFNFISIWAGVITIVFLVFSIYSIFKTDEILNRADKETRQIHKLLNDANETCAGITLQAQMSSAAMNSGRLNNPKL